MRSTGKTQKIDFEVSDADTMLRHLAPGYRAEEDVSLFTKPGCPHCARAKRLLEDAGIAFEEIALGAGVTRKSLRAVTGADTVPQVFIGGAHVGGADDLEKWLAERGERING